LVVFVDDAKDTGIARWYASGDISHHSGHQYVTGPFAGVEAVALPGLRYGSDFQFRGIERTIIAALEYYPLMGGHAE
jgi:hypothetical protein